MTIAISDGITTYNPLLLTGWETSRQSGNVLHTIVGASAVDATLREAGLRTGELQFLCADMSAALAIEALVSQAVELSLTVTETDLSIAMDFVASGSITVAIDEDSRELWTVGIEFQEIQ